jgi:uncharacterized RDD family membrane protein YckC
MKKASLGIRFIALLLDGLFISIINGLLTLVSLYYFMFLFSGPITMFLYYGICEGSSMSATLGKKICGIVVVDEHGSKLTMGEGFLRSLCRILSGMTLGIGYLIALFDQDNRALHDRLVKTLVVTEASLSQSVPVPPSPAPVPEKRSVTMNNQPHFIGMTGQFAGKKFYIQSQGAIIGRDAASCDFVFPDNTPGVSRNHCKISFNPQTQLFVLYDLGSSYGTFLGNGNRVSQGMPTALHAGDEFYVASRANSFRVNI